MEPRPGESRIHPGWWTLALVACVAGSMVLTAALYNRSFDSYVPVTLRAERSGLVMDTGAKVMMSGVQVGRVARIERGGGPAGLRREIRADEIKHIPSNVGAQIRASTVFGAKFVDLTFPQDPSPQRLTANAVLVSSNVTTEVNTVFQNLVNVLDQIDPAKLNAVLTAFSQGFRGQGQRIGETISDANQILLELNPRNNAIRQDWRAIKDFSDTYAASAVDILAIIDAASTTSTTISNHASDLDALLLSSIGFAQSGTRLLAENKSNFIEGINVLEPTTALLLKYDPVYTCTLTGSTWLLEHGALAGYGGNGYSSRSDSSTLLGKDPYQYPDNLPIIAAKGGPGGKPGCGSLPDPSKMYPVRQLVTNTGFGTGLDWRPNPGLGHPCWVDYLPVTRAVPEPPSIRQCLPGPAPGPVTAPGMPPYGASLYGPGGVPLWPGIPPAGVPPPVAVPGTPVAPGKIPPAPPASPPSP